MILVIAIGFGAMPGVLALGIHTMGFLAKFYAEDIEHINKGPVEALEIFWCIKRTNYFICNYSSNYSIICCK